MNVIWIIATYKPSGLFLLRVGSAVMVGLGEVVLCALGLQCIYHSNVIYYFVSLLFTLGLFCILLCSHC